MAIVLSTHTMLRKSSLAALCGLAVIFSSVNVNAFSPSPIIPSKSSSSTRNTKSSSTSLSAAAAAATPPSYSILFGLSLKRSTSQAKQQPLFDIPSIFNPSDSRPIVLFDGKCNLCNAGVQLILDSDRASSDPRGNLRVAALQSRVGRVLLARLPEEQRATVLSITNNDDKDGDGKQYKSIVVAGQYQTWLNSAACIRIGKELKGPLRYLALLASLIPSVIRDPLYKLLSKYRKKLFGEAEGCRLWDDNWDTRFVNDYLFGGKNGEIDPFADPSAQQEEEEEEVDDDDDVDVEDPPAGTPPLKVGDSVRVISSKPILHSHAGGVCSVGLMGTVTRVLERRAYPKNVVVNFEYESSSSSKDGDEEEKTTTSFEAHFFPGQLRKE